MVTAAGVAHVNRLPVLFLPGDVFANRAPDPVLQQIEDFGDGTVSANDCFRPVALFRPHHAARTDHSRAARAMQVLTDPGRVRTGDAVACARTCRPKPMTIPESLFRRNASGRNPPAAARCARTGRRDRR
jgi:3D-(3,5/4)-trihydroxycyclohexane-1,2-dione acylhydrolase (decyclizing)